MTLAVPLVLDHLAAILHVSGIFADFMLDVGSVQVLVNAQRLDPSIFACEIVCDSRYGNILVCAIGERLRGYFFRATFFGGYVRGFTGLGFLSTRSDSTRSRFLRAFPFLARARSRGRRR